MAHHNPPPPSLPNGGDPRPDAAASRFIPTQPLPAVSSHDPPATPWYAVPPVPMSPHGAPWPPTPPVTLMHPQGANPRIHQGRVLLTIVHGGMVGCIGIAALIFLAFADDVSSQAMLYRWTFGVLLVAGGLCLPLVIGTWGIWRAKPWAYWGTVVLHSASILFWGNFVWQIWPDPSIWLCLPPSMASVGTLIAAIRTWPSKHAT